MLLNTRSYLLVALGMMLLSGCGYKSVDVENKVLKDLSSAYNKDGLVKDSNNQYIAKYNQWYKSFNNPELNHLITVAISNDFDINTAQLRLQAAAAQMGEQRSAFLPKVNVQYEAQKSKSSNSKIKNSADSDYNTLGINASYEIDLWGKNYADYKSASTKLQATALGVETAKITVAADMLNLWVNLMVLREQKANLIKIIHNNNSMLEITKVKYNNGNATITELLNLQSSTLEAQSNLDNINYQEQDILRSMNIMMGKQPLSPLNIKSHTLPSVNQLPSKDLNIQILANRPDIKADFYNMLASKWDAKVATLSRLPSLTLTANASYIFDKGNVFDNWLITTVGNATMPIFQFGELRDREKAAKLLSEASVVEYKGTVFKAVQEFKGALDKEDAYFANLNNLKQQADLLASVEEQDNSAYLNGSVTYETVINDLGKLYKLQNDIITERQQLLLNRVYLYRSLGIPVKIKETTNEQK